MRSRFVSTVFPVNWSPFPSWPSPAHPPSPASTGSLCPKLLWPPTIHKENKTVFSTVTFPYKKWTFSLFLFLNGAPYCLLSIVSWFEKLGSYSTSATGKWWVFISFCVKMTEYLLFDFIVTFARSGHFSEWSFYSLIPRMRRNEA